MASKLSSFLVELKRRKVYRVATVYVVVGAGIIGLADAALPSWEQLQVPVVVLILIGFPIALILAWAYEVRPEEPRAEKPNFAQAEDRKSIVVLPFDNMSPDPGARLRPGTEWFVTRRTGVQYNLESGRQS
jgi:hypothetical protein